MNELSEGEIGPVFADKQRKDLKSNLRPWSELFKEEKIKNGLDVKWLLREMEIELDGIANSEDLKELQSWVAIYNVDDFKLKETPTKEEFEDLLRDFRKWMERVRGFIKGSEEDENVFWQKFEESIKAASDKFDELSGKKQFVNY